MPNENYPLPYPADELIARAVVYGSLEAWEAGSPRWSAVGNIFTTGSGYSADLCRRYGVDPNEVKKGRRKKKD
jgi:hypothetical protein